MQARLSAIEVLMPRLRQRPIFLIGKDVIEVVALKRLVTITVDDLQGEILPGQGLRSGSPHARARARVVPARMKPVTPVRQAAPWHPAGQACRSLR
jgi:hypothetical protein